MPFVRISMRRGRDADAIRAISAAVQRALEAAFEVPPHDCFQAIHQHEPHELVFDRDYMAGPRSGGFLLLDIRTGRPRSDEVKQAFYRRVVAELAPLDVLPQDVMVVVTNAGPADWSFGDGVAQMLAGARH